MKVITADDFLEVLNHLETMDPEEELEPLIDRFGEEQPFLAAYLDGAPVTTALKWGCAAAALKRATPGDLSTFDKADLLRLVR